MNYDVLNSTLHPSSPQMSSNCARDRSLPRHPLRPGCLGSAQAPPAGPGGARPPNVFMHLWPENEDWERLNSLNRLLAELGAKHAF